MTNTGLTPRKSALLRNREVNPSVSGRQRRCAQEDGSRIGERKRPRALSGKILLRRLLLRMRSRGAWSDGDAMARTGAVLGSVCLLLLAASDGRTGWRGLVSGGGPPRRAGAGGGARSGAAVGDMRSLGYSSKPLCVGAFFDGRGSVTGVSRLPSQPDYYPSQRMAEEMTDMAVDPKGSKRYKRKLRDPVDVGDCVAKEKWQKEFYPSCSNVHEIDFYSSSSADAKVKLLNNGYFSDIFRMKGFDGEYFVLKSMRYVHDFTDRNYHRYEKEATSMEKLTSSPHIVDIYGFCGGTSLIEYSDGGDLGGDALERRHDLSQLDKLRIAHQVAVAIADVHSLPIAHTDITLWQFLKIKGAYKLNDFNRVRWMRWDKEKKEDCGFKVAVNGGKWRAPEEYAYAEETEKIDVYSLGNILYVLLTGRDVFQGVKSDDVHQQVQEGVRPHVPPAIRDNADSVDSSLMMAMQMCHVQDPKKRSSARTVADFLHAELVNYEHMIGAKQ